MNFVYTRQHIMISFPEIVRINQDGKSLSEINVQIMFGNHGNRWRSFTENLGNRLGFSMVFWNLMCTVSINGLLPE